jgi:hypothetical protein
MRILSRFFAFKTLLLVLLEDVIIDGQPITLFSFLKFYKKVGSTHNLKVIKMRG